MRKLLVRLLAPAALAWAVAIPVVQAQTTPVQAFFMPPKMAQPVVSPDGKRLAVLVGNDRTGRRDLLVMDLGPPVLRTTAASFVDADIRDVQWVNNERLVYTLSQGAESLDAQPCLGLWAVDHDGGSNRRLVRDDCRSGGVTAATPTARARELPSNHRLLRVLRDGSADVIVERLNLDAQQRQVLDTAVLRLNTLSGQARAAVEPGYPAGAQRWLVDASGSARLVATAEGGQTQLHWRAADDAPWQRIASFDTFLRGPQAFDPIVIGPDGELYARAVRDNAERTSALFRFDRRTLKLEPEPLVGISGFDFVGAPVFDHAQRKLLGARYTGDATGHAWLDDDLKQVQAQVDRLAPGRVNLLLVPECNCTRRIVVFSYTDANPGHFTVFDPKARFLEHLGWAMPHLGAFPMAARDFARFDARDGLSIPVHVTRPAGKGPWPTVVLVHGGPWIRGGSWQWTPLPQFLASRGYLVVEPEFRGSDGYGERHLRAGFRQWGLKMQDDLADATRWAIERKLADPQRVCIAGASYGGYATLMGLIRDPDLYRCGVAWAAVTDIGLMFDWQWTSDLPEAWRRHGMPALIGDPVQDAAQLDATSPLKQAHRLHQPVLLAFGGSDRRVPIEQGTRFRDAVKKTNEQVEWIEYADEAHGFVRPKNVIDFYNRMAKFLATHLQAK